MTPGPVQSQEPQRLAVARARNLALTWQRPLNRVFGNVASVFFAQEIDRPRTRPSR
ncbi:hypothetical protein [Streptomyces sp. NRRL F-5122]|uniref:hypothetical protein n=1 Tax=Streptomyces sp. NRRL F-5122 TaxID=1609098 RepID=UPI000AA4A5C7|nr:hypothetical protein [Streptomyces sp. NRRL F-5122]